MVSHATAYNTILQEGNLRTATPFISIKDNDKGEDIYKKRQKSDNQPFPTRTLNIEKKEDAEKILLARQMANLLTDSQSRKPEFGPLWVNLNVRNYGNGLSDGLAAAKTGTTNGPKDFWTCGGSVYYTVCVWAGRTDNKNMLSSASSGRVAALLWQSIMENIHADKTPVKFSTQGLIPAYVGGSKGKENPETGEIEGATQGRLELLTPKQNSEKFIKNGVVSFQTKEQVEEFKKKDIFENRTALLTASYYINSLDGGLFVEGKTPEQLKKEVTCQLLVGEFPQSPNWNEPIVRLAKSSDKYCTLPDPSTQNEVDDSPPVFNTNFTTGVINNINQVNISANFATESGKKVKKMELFINSSLVSATENQNSVSAPIQPSNSAYKITVKVTDTLNKTYVKEYLDIKVGSPLTASDVSNISCSSSGLCTFNILDPSKPFNQIQLSHQSVIYTCSINAMLVTCNLNGVNLSGVTTLGVLIDGNSYVKNVTVIP
jgi:membrane carboxypeptidase/penicillin-binding protein PbpC